jgi:hypothetical protein
MIFDSVYEYFEFCITRLCALEWEVRYSHFCHNESLCCCLCRLYQISCCVDTEVALIDLLRHPRSVGGILNTPSTRCFISPSPFHDIFYFFVWLFPYSPPASLSFIRLCNLHPLPFPHFQFICRFVSSCSVCERRYPFRGNVSSRSAVRN